jgi:two-component system sensor histidine kinase EvgS
MRILIADDERITRMTLARQLQGWGHEVTVAEDGQQAWEAFAAGEFDLELTDWEMPRMSGPELVHRIREARRAV